MSTLTRWVTIYRRSGFGDAKQVWEGRAAVHDLSERGLYITVDAPLELVPQEVPFVRLPKEDPDA